MFPGGFKSSLYNFTREKITLPPNCLLLLCHKMVGYRYSRGHEKCIFVTPQPDHTVSIFWTTSLCADLTTRVVNSLGSVPLQLVGAGDVGRL